MSLYTSFESYIMQLSILKFDTDCNCSLVVILVKLMNESAEIMFPWPRTLWLMTAHPQCCDCIVHCFTFRVQILKVVPQTINELDSYTGNRTLTHSLLPNVTSEQNYNEQYAFSATLNCSTFLQSLYSSNPPTSSPYYHTDP